MDCSYFFFTSSFKRYTGTDHTVRIPIIFKTDCEIEPTEVIHVLEEVALTHQEVLHKPRPDVFILEDADNAAVFQLNIWLDNPVISPRIKSEVKLRVWNAFTKHGIALPFPETEIHFSNRKPLAMASVKQAVAMPTPAIPAD